MCVLVAQMQHDRELLEGEYRESALKVGYSPRALREARLIRGISVPLLNV